MKYIIAAFIFAILVTAFALQNALPVTVSFMVWNLQTSLVLVILGAATAGALAVLSISLWMRFQLHRQNRRLERQLKEMETENQLLRQRLEQAADGAGRNQPTVGQ